MSLPPGIEAAAGRSPLVAEALQLAREAHRGQVRNASGGMDYVEHPIAVAELLAMHGYGDRVLAAAVLHDVVEDSEIGPQEIERRFGGEVGGIVAALTDDETIEPYERRKDEHRRRVCEAGAEPLAIYAADKLTNVRALRHAYTGQGEGVEAEMKVPLDVKTAVWEADLDALREAAPKAPFVAELEAELSGLRADRLATGQPSG